MSAAKTLNYSAHGIIHCIFCTPTHIVQLIGKDKHGIRAKDLDSKDKQNFAAVEHLIKASHFLGALPDALGTKCYLEVTKAAVYSYLEKSISPEQRLEEIWYATFFFRYWRSG